MIQLLLAVIYVSFISLEQTTGLWGSSFLVLHHGVSPEEAARFAGLLYLGITIGRAVSGFLTMALNDAKLVRLGEAIILTGIGSIVLFNNRDIAKIGLVLIGLGCAPIYPSIIHSTPEHFGADKSQVVIGIQMASAYVGTCIMPPIFGLIAEHINIVWLPVYLLVILVIMFVMHEKMIVKSGKGSGSMQ